VDRVLAGRLPTLADVARLPYVEQVITESMRLYPPAWLIGRRAIAEYPIDEYFAAPRSIIVLSPYLLHRDARFFPDPSASRRSGGRRSSKRSCRRSRTFHLAAALAAASANHSPGWN